MITVGFNEGFYSGASLATAVPGQYHVALDGRPFMLDLGQNFRGRFRHATIPLLKQQQQTDGSLGEQSLNPKGLWRRSMESWHKGAGQTWFDLADSDPARFYASKGVDPWTKWNLTLLPDTDQKRSSANTNLALIPVGSYLYLVDGTALLYTQDVTVGSPTWTTVTGTPGGSILSAASDGYTVYVTDGSNIYSGTRGGASVASWSAFDSDLLAYVKGRLMSGHDNVASNITAAGTKTDVVTHPNTDFRFTGFAEGRNCIYMAGFSGDKSLIYRTAVKADGTALDVGVVAGELPDGEIVRSVAGYLGFLLIGTDQGIRFAVQDDNGDLTIGALIELGAAVYCFEGQGSFVWFGWTNYDGTSTGLGRISLTTLNGSAPAYASDLMAAGQGSVLSACTFQSRRVFAVSALGVYGEETAPVTEGTLTSGWVSFGIPDDKVALEFDVRHEPLVGTVEIDVAKDGSSTYTPVGVSAEAGTPGAKLPVSELVAERFQVKSTLVSSGGVSPTVTRLVLGMNPTADTGQMLSVPVILASDVVDRNGNRNPREPMDDLEFIETLRSSRQVVAYQWGNRRFSVSVEDFEFFPLNDNLDGSEWSGTLVLELKVA